MMAQYKTGIFIANASAAPGKTESNTNVAEERLHIDGLTQNCNNFIANRVTILFI